LADDGGIERVQLRAESPAVEKDFMSATVTVIFGVFDSVRLI
jgi:hypothetical protein